jgi:hypothetical protein
MAGRDIRGKLPNIESAKKRLQFMLVYAPRGSTKPAHTHRLSLPQEPWQLGLAFYSLCPTGRGYTDQQSMRSVRSGKSTQVPAMIWSV